MKLEQMMCDFSQIIEINAIRLAKKYSLTDIQTEELIKNLSELFKIGLIVGGSSDYVEYEKYKTIFLAVLEAGKTSLNKGE